MVSIWTKRVVTLTACVKLAICQSFPIHILKTNDKYWSNKEQMLLKTSPHTTKDDELGLGFALHLPQEILLIM